MALEDNQNGNGDFVLETFVSVVRTEFAMSMCVCVLLCVYATVMLCICVCVCGCLCIGVYRAAIA